MNTLDIFLNNIKLAYKHLHIAHWGYIGTSLEDDLKQACLVGLWRAIKAWDSRKQPLKNYAIDWMRSECTEVLRKAKAVKIPQREWKKGLRLDCVAIEIGDMPPVQVDYETIIIAERVARLAGKCEVLSTVAMSSKIEASRRLGVTRNEVEQKIERLRAACI